MQNTGQNNSLGKIGEDAAAEYLAKNGFKILARNWRLVGGLYGTHGFELDIIVESKKELVFVEVKSRKSASEERVYDNFTSRKQQKLQKAASLYLNETQNWHKQCRFDLICALVSTDGRVQLEHHQNVVEFRNTLDSSNSSWQPW